jgi:hypothetical protein
MYTDGGENTGTKKKEGKRDDWNGLSEKSADFPQQVY